MAAKLTSPLLGNHTSRRDGLGLLRMGLGGSRARVDYAGSFAAAAVASAGAAAFVIASTDLAADVAAAKTAAATAAAAAATVNADGWIRKDKRWLLRVRRARQVGQLRLADSLRCVATLPFDVLLAISGCRGCPRRRPVGSRHGDASTRFDVRALRRRNRLRGPLRLGSRRRGEVASGEVTLEKLFDQDGHVLQVGLGAIREKHADGAAQALQVDRKVHAREHGDATLGARLRILACGDFDAVDEDAWRQDRRSIGHRVLVVVMVPPPALLNVED